MDLGDPRRNQRAIRLIERLSAQPTASVPQACGDWADTLAAYRFFDNDKVSWATVCTHFFTSDGLAKVNPQSRQFFTQFKLRSV